MTSRAALSVLTLLLGAASASTGVAAQDLLYRHRPVEVQALARYGEQPYWRVLAICAGMHGALVNQYEAQARPAEGSAAKARALAFMGSALRQAQADRGLDRSGALDLVTPAVNEGRVLGSALLQRRTNGYTAEQLVDVMCTQVSERHAQATRGR